MLVAAMMYVRCGVAGVASVCERAKARTHTHTCQKELIFGCVYGSVRITLNLLKNHLPLQIRVVRTQKCWRR